MVVTVIFFMISPDNFLEPSTMKTSSVRLSCEGFNWSMRLNSVWLASDWNQA